MAGPTYNDRLAPLSFDVVEDAPDFQNIGQVAKQDYLNSWADQAYNTVYGDPINPCDPPLVNSMRSRADTMILKQTLVVLIQGAALTQSEREEYIDLYEGRVMYKPQIRRVVDALLNRFRQPGRSLKETLYKAAETVSALQYVTLKREELDEEDEETDALSVEVPDPRAPEFQTFREEYPGTSPLKAYSLGLENLTDKEVEMAFGLDKQALNKRLSFDVETLKQGQLDKTKPYEGPDWAAEWDGGSTWIDSEQPAFEDFNYAQDPVDRPEEKSSQFNVAENPYVEDEYFPPATFKDEGVTIDFDVYVLPFDRTDPEKLAEYTAHLLRELMRGTLVKDESDTLPMELDLLVSQAMMTAARGMAELSGDDKYLKAAHDAVLEGYNAGQQVCAMLLGYAALRNEQLDEDWSMADLIMHGMRQSEGWEEPAEEPAEKFEPKDTTPGTKSESWTVAGPPVVTLNSLGLSNSLNQ